MGYADPIREKGLYAGSYMRVCFGSLVFYIERLSYRAR